MLRPGKLPIEQLSTLLARLGAHDPRILLGPAVGRDAAAIDIGNGRVLVATSDPVTFAAEDIGWYALNVNANDVACMGARPAWFLATVLLPAGSPPALPEAIFRQLGAAADALGVSIVGGHTEVTSGIDRPIIAGTMLGECTRADLIDGSGVAPGDAVVLCGEIAIEGTALLAREAPAALRRTGVTDAELDAARGLLFDPGVSVVAAARALGGIARPRLLHDPTEGGIATALHELAAAAGWALRIDSARIPVRPETARICEALGLDAFGLLASGALLAIMPAESAPAIARSGAVPRAKIIGWIEAGPVRVILEPGAIPFPSFDRDEIARFFDETAGGADERHP